MNVWFDRLQTAFAEIAASAENVPAAAVEAARLSAEEAQALLDVAREAAHISGSRQYAPLATYLAGRVAQAAAAGADPAARAAIIRAFIRAVQAAGPAGEPG